jgi:hypothetical protein
MADEFDNIPDNSENNYSSFWPLLILFVGLLIWLGYQDYTLNSQRSFYRKQIQDAGSTIQAAQNWQGRYAALMKDLNDTSAKDSNAVPILRAAVQAGVQAGLIHVNANSTNNTAAPAEPSK